MRLYLLNCHNNTSTVAYKKKVFTSDKKIADTLEHHYRYLKGRAWQLLSGPIALI